MFSKKNTATETSTIILPGMITSSNNTPTPRNFSPAQSTQPIAASPRPISTVMSNTTSAQPIIASSYKSPVAVKRKKLITIIIRILVPIAVIGIAVFVFAKTTDLFGPSIPKIIYDESIFIEKGVAVRDIIIEGSPASETKQFRVLLENYNRSDAEFDFSKFSLAYFDGERIQPSPDYKLTIEANSSTVEWAFLFTMDEIVPGDEVTVYYDDKEVYVVQVSGLSVRWYNY